jgi:glutamate carboxypeptidase
MHPPGTELPAGLFTGTIELLRELTAISSPSGDSAGLRRMAERLAAALRERGLAAEVREEPGEGGGSLPVLYATAGAGTEADAGSARSGDAEGERATGAGTSGAGASGEATAGARVGTHGAPGPSSPLLLVGHLDTVLPAREPHLTGEALIATGAVDMKGGLAALAGALDLLARRGLRPPADLLLVVVPDEEVGGTLSRAVVERWGERARALWVLEPGEPAGEAETLVAGRRGLFQWRLEVHGRAAHSGLHYWAGRSALAAAAAWCVDAQALSWRAGGPTVNCGRLVAGDQGFVGDLAGTHGLLGTERQLNVVPDRAVVEGEARFLRVAEGHRLEGRLEALAAKVADATGTELRFTATTPIPPVDPHGAHRDRCEQAIALAAARGWRLELEEERGGISFPNFLPDPNRLPVLDGLGPVGGGMHTRDEFVDLRSLRRRIVLLADLLAEEAGRARHPSGS